MFKIRERKEFPSHWGGTLADSRPTLFDAKKCQMDSRKQILLLKLAPPATVV